MNGDLRAVGLAVRKYRLALRSAAQRVPPYDGGEGIEHMQLNDVNGYQVGDGLSKLRAALLDEALKRDQDESARRGALVEVDRLLVEGEKRAADLKAALPGLERAAADAEKPRRAAWERKQKWLLELGHGPVTLEELDQQRAYDSGISAAVLAAATAQDTLQRGQRRVAEAVEALDMLRAVKAAL